MVLTRLTAGSRVFDEHQRNSCLLLELCGELFIVQEDIGIVELVVPSIFELLDAASDAIDITIACWTVEAVRGCCGVRRA